MQTTAALRAAALLQPLLRSAPQLAGPLAAACSLHTQPSIPSILHTKSDERSKQQQQMHSAQSVGGFAARHASSAPQPSEVTPLAPGEENSWSKFRAPYGLELKSSLGPAMYLMIATFGFSLYINDAIYHPPRVVAMLGLMMLLMYVRKG